MKRKSVNHLTGVILAIVMTFTMIPAMAFGATVIEPSQPESTQTDVVEQLEVKVTPPPLPPEFETSIVVAVMYNDFAYPTLEDALAAVNDKDQVEDVLTLVTDINIDGTLETGIINKPVTLDLGGFTIKGDKADGLIQCNSPVKLKNGSIENTSQDIKGKAVKGNVLIDDSMKVTPGQDWLNSKIIKMELKKFDITTQVMVGGKSNPNAGAISPNFKTVNYGESVTLTLVPASGYKVKAIKINGQVVTNESTYRLTDIKEYKEVVAEFERTGIYIMLDPGHGANEVNQTGSYKEHEAMWILANYLKAELEKYENVFVSMTKSTLDETPAVYTRGLMAEGYDLLLSLHSNWSTDPSDDYPLAIVSSRADLNPVAKAVGLALAKTLKTTMNTVDDYQIWTRLNDDGTDWYGVIRGAAKVNTPAVLLEHSFHSNDIQREGLMDRGYIWNIANAEAVTLANYYGLALKGAEDQPIGLATKVNSPTSITVSWNSLGGVSGYSLYRSIDPVKGYEYVGSTRDTYYTDNGVSPGNTYYYKVKGYTWIGNGQSKDTPLSQLVVAQTPEANGLSAPRAVSGTALSFDKISISWEQVSGAGGYNIYRADSYDGQYKYLGSTKDLNYTDTGLESETTYFYKVNSYQWSNGDAIKSKDSIVTQVKTMEKPYVGAVNNLVAKGVSTSQIEITWTATPEANGYNIYRSTEPDGQYGYVASTGSTSFTDTDLEAGKDYYYKVCGYQWLSAGNAVKGPMAGPANGKTLNTAFVDTPRSFTATSTSQSTVNLTWQPATGVNGYNIYRSTEPEGTYAYVTSTGSTTYSDSGLTSGKTYYYKICAYMWISSGNAAKSTMVGPVSVKTASISGPSVPTGVYAYGSGQKTVVVAWDQVPGASGYNVYRRTTAEGPFEYYGSTRNTYFVDSGLNPGQTYYYRVSAYTWTGNGQAVSSGTSAMGWATP